VASRSVVVRVPGLGEFSDVEVTEILVAPGDRVAAEESLITIESDKASMEIPTPHAGVVSELRVREGDRVSEGSEIAVVELLADEPAARSEAALAPREPAAVPAAPPPAPSAPAPKPAESAAPPEAREPARPARPTPSVPSGERLRADVLVLGAGPGGYTAAFRAADLGKRVVLVERFPVLGGVCLHVGCIPSKALLHVAEGIHEAAALAEAGVEFGPPKLDLARLRARKDGVVKKLADGLAGLAKRREVVVRTGRGSFEAANRIRIEGSGPAQEVEFEHAILAVGSRAVALPGLPDDPRIMDATGALALADVPQRLLVIGGGVIGLELATVYEALGSRVSVVEMLPELLTGVDPDLVRPLRKHVEKRYEAIWCGTRVVQATAEPAGIRVRFDGPGAPAEDRFDRVLVAIGRRGRGDEIGAERAGLRVDERGFVAVDAEQRTHVPHLFAIGDLTGPPLLAHRAMHQGKVAAERIAGLPASFDPLAMPSIAYTDPEIAWAGLTETEARARGIEVEKAVFPWSANARALGLARGEGLTKLLFAKEHGRLVGAGIVGARAGELLAEAVVAIEMGADAHDLALAVHPHPTLSESIGLAAELAAGTITDLVAPRKRPAPAPEKP
jgi:dihydrolipoamide dehydrogenase